MLLCAKICRTQGYFVLHSVALCSTFIAHWATMCNNLLNTRLLNAAIFSTQGYFVFKILFQFLFQFLLQSALHFVFYALLAQGYKEANTAFVRSCTRPPLHAILYSRLGRKILSGIVVLFSRGREQKSSTMGSVARAEGCSGKRPTFMTTSPPLHQCPDSQQLQNNKRRQKATNIHGTLSTTETGKGNS